MLENAKTESEVFQLLDNRVNICRFCLNHLDENKSYSLFDKDLLVTLEFCYRNLLFSTLKSNSGLPGLICSACHSSLQDTYTFLMKITWSENICKHYISYIESINSSVDVKGHLVQKDNVHFENVVGKNAENDLSDETENIDSDTSHFTDLFNELSRADGRKKGLKRNKTNNQNIKRKKVNERYHDVHWKHKCPHCTKNYRSNWELKVHLRSHTGERPFTCTVCGKTFLDNRNLRRHEKIHTGNKQHECSVCHKRFLHLFSLRTHERIHKGEKQYVCEMCGKAFNTCGELKIHTRIHTKEKPYVCSVCEKAFASKGALNIHTRIHTGDKRHACLICARKCRTAYDLKVHMRCHNNEKPYVCQYLNCDKRYKRSSQLNVHLRTHTGEKSHQCHVCLKKFGESNSLKRHLTTHEKNLEEMSEIK